MLIWTPEPNSYVDTDSEPNSYVDTDPKPNFLCWYADPEPNFLCWYADPEPNFFIRIWSRIWISLTVVTVCRKTLKLYGFWRSYNQDPQRWLAQTARSIAEWTTVKAMCSQCHVPLRLRQAPRGTAADWRRGTVGWRYLQGTGNTHPEISSAPSLSSYTDNTMSLTSLSCYSFKVIVFCRAL